MNKTYLIHPPSIEELQQRMKSIEDINLILESIDSIRSHIDFITIGHKISVPQFKSGLEMFRIRKFPDSVRPLNVRDIGVPPRELVKFDQRCSRAGETMFYCSSGRNAPFFETHVQDGDYVVLSKWKTTKPSLVNHVGYTSENFEKLNSSRATPTWGKKNVREEVKARILVDQFLSSRFSVVVPDNELYRYKETIAITERLIPHPSQGSEGTAIFTGIMYPTIPMSGNCENFALFPEFFRDSIVFISSEFIFIKKIEGINIEIDVIDFADGITDSGVLNWKGRPKQWVLRHKDEELEMSVVNGEWVATRPDGTIAMPE